MAASDSSDHSRQNTSEPPESDIFRLELVPEEIAPQTDRAPLRPPALPPSVDGDAALRKLVAALPCEAAPPTDQEWGNYFPELYCPRCTYSLRGLEEAGMQQCPECGTPVNFNDLRQRLLVDKQELGGAKQLFRRIMWFPNRFFTALDAPRRYLWIKRLDQYDSAALFAGIAGVVLAFALFFAVVTSFHGRTPPKWPASTIYFLSPLALWPFLFLGNHQATRWWIRRLLRWAAHPEPQAGALRVMFFAGPVYVAMVRAVLFGLLCLLLAILLSLLGTIPAIIALVCSGFSVVVYFVLWLHWAWVILRAFQAETRGLDTDLTFLAFFNPGLLVTLGGLTVLCALTLLA
jgi:hypothetical protein